MEHNRVLRLQHGINFRELGGYKTTDGQTIRWQKLLRCGEMNLLSSADLDYLDQYGLRYVFDLRSEMEAQSSPDKYPQSADYQNWSVYPFTDHHQLTHRFRRLFQRLKTGTPGEQAYSQMIIDSHPINVWQHLFATLLTNTQPDQSVVFHCAAGKDRTGIAAMLILGTLGVSEETIIQDYLLTNAVFEAMSSMDTATIITKANAGDLASQLNSEMSVEQQNLLTALKVIQDDYGDIPSYVQKVLKLSATDLQDLKRLYLTSNES